MSRTPLLTSGARAAAIGIVAAGLALASPAVAQNQSPDSLTETYASWTVRCAAGGEGGERRCVMAQTLQRDPGGERLLLTELSVQDGSTILAMLTPFGLAVSEGATLQTDTDTPRKVPFFTCLPSGCLVRQTLEEADLAAFRRGASLKTRFTVAQTGEPFELASSLEGFSAAYRRLRELADAP